MRRTFAIVLTVAALSAAAALLTTPAGGQTEGEGPSFEIRKDIHGEGPTGGFVIEYTCVDSEGNVVQSDSLNFDTAGPGVDEVQEVSVNTRSTCTIEETDANGADLVEYECEFFPAPPDSAAGVEGDGPGSCLDAQTAEFNDGGDFASFLVRNTFDADVLPDEEEPPAVDPDVVTATPPFTG